MSLDQRNPIGAPWKVPPEIASPLGHDADGGDDVDDDVVGACYIAGGFSQLEAIIGYTFSNKSLLIEVSFTNI